MLIVCPLFQLQLEVFALRDTLIAFDGNPSGFNALIPLVKLGIAFVYD